MINLTKKNVHQKFIPGIFQIDFRKCWLRQTLENIENFLSLPSILVKMHLLRSFRVLFFSYSIQHVYKVKALNLGEKKKITIGDIWQ